MRWLPAALVVIVTGCGWNARSPVDLRRVETKAVHFGLASPRSTICPGEPVDLQVFLDVVDRDGGNPRRLVQHRIELDETIFDMRQLHLSSAQGTFDVDGRYHPNDDVRASVQSGFLLYARAPNGPAFSVRFPPSYECHRSLGRAGTAGVEGNRGDDALVGDTNLHDLGAATGRTGGVGGRGGEGPRLTVYVTWVTTPDYTRLLAARATGDVDQTTLVAPGTSLEIIARGGAGGRGGRGGEGATAASDAERGGPGGQGGRGGDGGDGGQVDVILDDRFHDLDRNIMVDVRGGRGGDGGVPGPGGRSIASAHARRAGRDYAGRDGVVAPAGAPGVPGNAGERGRITVRAGKVAALFDALGPIVPL